MWRHGKHKMHKHEVAPITSAQSSQQTPATVSYLQFKIQVCFLADRALPSRSAGFPNFSFTSSRKRNIFLFDHELWPVPLTYEYDLHRVKWATIPNIYVKHHFVQKSLSGHTHTHTHTRTTDRLLYMTTKVVDDKNWRQQWQANDLLQSNVSILRPRAYGQ